MQKIDTAALRSLCQSDESAKALFKHFSRRDNNSLVSKVDRLVAVLATEGTPIGRADVIRVLRNLEELNCGVFRKGRTLQDGTQNPARFEWSVHLTSVGKAALGESTTVEAVEEAERETIDSEDATATIAHTYQLRPDFKVSVELPANLSAREAQRIAEFLKTLPFDDGSADR